MIASPIAKHPEMDFRVFFCRLAVVITIGAFFSHEFSMGCFLKFARAVLGNCANTFVQMAE